MKAAIANTRKLLDEEKNISPALKAAVEIIITLFQILIENHYVTKNSKNSSLPPAMDPNRQKKSKSQNERKPGGQPGHEGKTLQPVPNPTNVIEIKLDRGKPPPGKWREAGYESRQVFDMEITCRVTEYRAERLVNEKGEYWTADFPEGLVQKAQYGNGIKAHGVYLSVEQALPCQRISEHFENQILIPVSTGSICNFKKEAYTLLEYFRIWVISRLIGAKVLHCDETGINIASQREWMHSVSNGLLTYYYPHEKRGKAAMDSIGVIGKTGAVLVHDHWRPYY
jgi:transposase